MAVTAEQLKKFEDERAALMRLPIYLGGFDDETCAAKIINEAEASGDAWVANQRAGHDKYPAMCGHLEAVLVRVCEELHRLQHRPGEARARATRKRQFRDAMRRAA